MKEKKLKEIQLFSQNDLKIFNDYSIDTIEKLLGATSGLTKNMDIFDMLEFKELYIERIKQQLTEGEIDCYIEPSDQKPQGYIGNE